MDLPGRTRQDDHLHVKSVRMADGRTPTPAVLHRRPRHFALPPASYAHEPKSFQLSTHFILG